MWFSPITCNLLKNCFVYNLKNIKDILWLYFILQCNFWLQSCCKVSLISFHSIELFSRNTRQNFTQFLGRRRWKVRTSVELETVSRSLRSRRVIRWQLPTVARNPQRWTRRRWLWTSAEMIAGQLRLWSRGDQYFNTVKSH